MSLSKDCGDPNAQAAPGADVSMYTNNTRRLSWIIKIVGMRVFIQQFRCYHYYDRSHIEKVLLMRNAFLVIFFSTLLFGCESVNRVNENTAEPGPDEAFIILGIEPPRFQIAIFPGTIKDGVFSQNKLSVVAALGMPKDGYLVSKVKAGTNLGITIVKYVEDSTIRNLLTGNFQPCDGAKAMVFNVPKGKVLYLGSVNYGFQDNRITIKYDHDLGKAQRYVSSTFPGIKQQVESSEPNYLPTDIPCEKTFYIPVYR